MSKGKVCPACGNEPVWVNAVSNELARYRAVADAARVHLSATTEGTRLHARRRLAEALRAVPDGEGENG